MTRPLPEDSLADLHRRLQQLEAENAALRDSEERYRALFDSMDEGFCVIEFLDGPHGPDSDYIHVQANAAFARHAGIPNVVGQRVRELVPDEADGWVAFYGKVLHTGEAVRFERELVATGRHLALSAFRLGPPEQKLIAVLFQDVTARRQYEAALQQLNETLEHRVEAALAQRKFMADIVEGTDAFVQMVDTDMRWLTVNSAAAREFERAFGTLPQVGEAVLDHVGALPAQRELLESLWTRALAGEEFVHVAAFGREGAQRSYEMRFSSLRDLQGGIVGAYQFAYDITDRLREQERLREAEAALRQSQKMEAVGQLTGGIAHDFNNLLQGIVGALELLKLSLQRERPIDPGRYIDAALGSTRRAASLTHRLLAFSRQQALDPEPADIGRLMLGLEELVGRTVGPHIALSVTAQPGLWLVLVDAGQLENAVLNLCINARDAMPDGGRLAIEAANRTLTQRAQREADLPPGEYVAISVADTGAGMSAEVAARAFDPFFTTKPLGEGTGLGLSMVYGFVQQSGGQVQIDSAPGRGTTVTLFLPRHVGAQVPATAQAPGAPSQARGIALPSASVLLVEDEPHVRMIAAEALQTEGYEVVEAGDGPSALRELERGRAVDLIVSDIGMPGGMNGRQFAEAARRLRPRVPVLFTTGYAANAVLGNEQLPAGMQVLTKPYALSELLERVRQALGG